MAKEQPAAKKEQPAERVTLDDFCTRLSESEKRYTIIAGFHATEVKTGTVRDTAAAYKARFAAFINRPA